jgi:hypothetical protein
METKGCQNEARDLPKHPLGNRSGKVRKILNSRDAFGSHFGEKSIKIPS